MLPYNICIITGIKVLALIKMFCHFIILTEVVPTPLWTQDVIQEFQLHN